MAIIKSYQLNGIPDSVEVGAFRAFSGGIADLNNLPQAQRKAGMFASIGDGSQLYKLKPHPWTYTDSYWGNPERFKFKASIDSFSTITELKDGEDRVVKSTFTINLYGYIVPDNIQKELTAVKKFNSKSQLILGLETSIVPGSAPITGSQLSPLFINGQQLIINYLSPTVLSYLNTNVQRLGTFVNSTTVTFASGWLTAPAGLPPTSLDNFSIFCNGVLIENAAIVSYTESNGVTTLVIDIFQLGYGFTPTDEIVAIGKFI